MKQYWFLPTIEMMSFKISMFSNTDAAADTVESSNDEALNSGSDCVGGNDDMMGTHH